MKKILVAALIVFPCAVQSQDINPNTFARSVSLMFFIGEICPNYYRVDIEQARQTSLSFAQMGNDAVGKKQFAALFKKELNRRGSEIQATGAQMWCTYQRGNMNQLNAQIFLN